ncbi:MAG: hypothetical protein KDA25_02510 [Phycisphaerales bacterium]|nr:hypothetical protein [Phycisphaerales bacterium]
MARTNGPLSLIVATVALLLSATSLRANAPLDQIEVDVAVDSGAVVNTAARRGLVYSTVVTVPDAPWIRLVFRELELGAPTIAGGMPTVMRLTSLADGHHQILDATTARQWRNTSAYFNGDAVLVEIIADPRAGHSRMTVDHVIAGAAPGAAATICGPDDDRLPSDDPRVARLVPIGCTAWLIDDPNHCFLSAGHCMGAPDVCEFNVPLSASNGDAQHPGPEDQYVVDASSIQSASGGLGNDWAYFGCFPNSTTNLTPFEAQGEFYTLAEVAPPPGIQTLRITGHGVDSSPLEWNTIQQTHVGPYTELSGTIIRYVVDTTGGNSGSAVFNEDTGEAIGIHTNGGCNVSGGQNSGCAIHNAGLQNALANPRGVCIPAQPLAFAFPDGLPDHIDNAGDTVRVVVSGDNGGTPAPGTGVLHLDLGDGFESIAMSETEPNVYDAPFPATECGSFLEYFFSAETTVGEIVNDVFNPDDAHFAQSGIGPDAAFIDDFESDLGWTVTNDAALTDGAWTRGVPIGGGDRGDPPADADGSGQCFLTDNVDGNSDVDDGSTTLTSPALDATDADDPHLVYWRWYSNTAGAAAFEDVFVVEISGDDGANWVELETVGPDGDEVQGGWYLKSFRIADYVAPTNQVRVRFIASDLINGSVVEAGVDGVRLNRTALGVECSDAGVPGDLDGDGDVDPADLAILLADWGGSGADLDGDGIVGPGDLAILLANWTL